ncbi:MAG: hypothetical protein Kow0022_07430 [Phycisphaerales bacterium]
MAPILALASSAGAADASGLLVPATLIYRLIVASVLAVIGIAVLVRTRFWRLPPEKLTDAIGPVTPAAWFFAALALYLLVSILSSIVSGIILGGAAPPGDFQSLAIAQGVFAGIACGLSIGTIVVLRRWDRCPPAGRSAWLAGFIRGVLSFVAAVPMLMLAADGAVLVHTLLTGFRPPAIAHETLGVLLEHRADPRVIWIIAAAVVGAPAFEETVYRGLLQRAVAGAFGSRWLGIVGTAVLFALSHRMGPAPVAWHALASILLVGLVCGFLREHPRAGLAGAIGFHAAFNLTNIILALYLIGPAGPD